MTYITNVVYDNDANAAFDMEYYIKTHMPLVQKHWGPRGLESWRVFDYSKDSSSPYKVHALLMWKDQASADDSISNHGAEVFGDVPKFTKLTPNKFAGHLVSSSSSSN
ncbi:hypothetical protein FA10DRAFT_268765 [Acaromyces ingoldii]|uniref:EthD domain-containing protein n=1 Tax=Acaromyces ingoldii TaxID=215250 RepID=A0A316YHN8_9BASI|nr:hypothetical protein FA10DRAFT_268765 [Acaromyces ingoldii]PWN88586.1 hypothetical protein FA10DRAFT_268765 [Acaromyces ingoldii]